ncbi:MAG: hypothetical protein RL226_1563 [Bacteroidota bacterium]|jgi:hypothetical protein
MKYALLILGIPLMTSCSVFREDPGAQMTEFRDIDTSYSSLSVDGDIQLIITQDPTYTLKIEAGENHLPYITTRVFNDFLEIKEERNPIRNNATVRVYISKSYLNDMTLDGSGSIDGAHLVAGNADILLNGSGDIDLQYDSLVGLDFTLDGSGNARFSGEANAFNGTINGSGNLDARYLPVNNASVNINGSGTARVNASQYLNIHIDGSGEVFYWGNPADVDIDISGSGQVIDME